MTMIASERVEVVVRVVEAAGRKAAEAGIKELEQRGVINGNNFQRIIAQGDKIAERVKVTVMKTLAELVENVVGRLKLISGGKKVVLAATDGKETLADAKDVFTTYVDPDFKNWGCDKKSAATPETEVAVYEMVKDGTFAELFGGFGENLDRVCLTQAQIKAFARDHKNWLRTDGYATLFLFKVGIEYFVADVFVDSDGLYVLVRRFSGDHVWRAEGRRRVVVPQLALNN